jgi:LemA protein
MLALLLGVGLLVVIALAIIVIFNGFVSKRNRVQDAWAQIDVQLKRRYDLIPNLINTVKGYMKYEKNVLTTVTALRSSIVTGTTQQKAQANDQLSQALKSIFAVAENYPDLKASETFKNLQDELETTEDKISFVRSSYNDYVLEYNNSLQMFPGNIFANMFNFKPAEFFKAPEAAAAEPVKVDFSDMNNDDPKADAKPASAPAKKPSKNKKSAQQTGSGN